MKTITKENAKTKSEISALLYAHKQDNFHEFIALVEEMLDRYHTMKCEEIRNSGTGPEITLKYEDGLKPTVINELYKNHSL